MKIRSFLLSVGIAAVLIPVSVSAFVQSDLDKLLATKECKKCDLSGADLSGKLLAKAQLDGADLSGANLSHSILRMADLDGASLKDANLSFTVLEAADLHRANFEGATMEGTIFDGAYLAEVIFSTMAELPVEHSATHDKVAANVSDTTPGSELDLAGGDSRAVITSSGGAVDVGTNMNDHGVVSGGQSKPIVVKKGTESVGVSLTKIAGPQVVDPNEYVLDPANNISGYKPLPDEQQGQPTTESDMLPLSKNDLLDRIDDTRMCVGCDFSGMDLSGEKFKGVYLEGGIFEGATLTGANFTMANLKGANLRKANLRGADLREADLYKADLSEADLTGADLREVMLDGAVLAGANLEGTVLASQQK